MIALACHYPVGVVHPPLGGLLVALALGLPIPRFPTQKGSHDVAGIEVQGRDAPLLRRQPSCLGCIPARTKLRRGTCVPVGFCLLRPCTDRASGNASPAGPFFIRA